MSASGNICASIFLVVSMLFILLVHINGFVYQIPEEPLFAFLFLPIPVIFSIGSVAWLWTTYKGAEKGGYPVYIEDILPARLQKSVSQQTIKDSEHPVETQPKTHKSL